MAAGTESLDAELLKDLRGVGKPPSFEGNDAEYQDFRFSFRTTFHQQVAVKIQHRAQKTFVQELRRARKLSICSWLLNEICLIEESPNFYFTPPSRTHTQMALHSLRSTVQDQRTSFKTPTLVTVNLAAVWAKNCTFLLLAVVWATFQLAAIRGCCSDLFFCDKEHQL